jgi:serine/threonine-protein kinase
MLTELRAALAGRYEIEREIGRGGMATVYLANDVRHGRRVALKVLHPDLAAALGAERFLAEIKTTAQLQHPHILTLYDSGNADGALYYVMPFVEGESLRARLERERQLPVQDALRIAREVADALGHAHAHGVIHRDIKPENILLQGGHALVADFGIALAVQEAGGQRLTQTGLSLGTPQYMSPEQATGERSIDARADLYALGCVTYEMLAGEPPFVGPTIQAIVAKVLMDTPRPLVELRKSVPEPVSIAVARALEKVPADRPSSASEFAAALSDEAQLPTSGYKVRGVQSRQASPIVTWVSVAFGVAAIAYAAIARRGAPASAGVARTRFTVPITTVVGGTGNTIAISPDGSKIVFRSRDNARLDLALRAIDTDSIVHLASTDEGDVPFFSPDGKSLGFVRAGKLYRFDFATGEKRLIADLGTDAVVFAAAWSTNGTIIFAGENRALQTVPAAGGTPAALAKADKAVYSGFQWLPGEDRVLATRQSVVSGPLEIAVLSAKTGELLETIMPGRLLQYVDSGELVYATPDGAITAVHVDSKTLKPTSSPGAAVTGIASISFFSRALPVAVSRSGTIAVTANYDPNRDMVLVRQGEAAKPLPLSKRGFRAPRFSPDGKRIAVAVETTGDLVGDVWLYDLAAGTFSVLTREGVSVFPEWSANGSDVLYSANDSKGTRALFEVPADRSAAPKELVSAEWPVFEGVAAPNGGPIVYRVNSEKTGRDLYVTTPGGSSKPLAATSFQERAPAISPDGKLLLYTSNESGADEVIVRRLDGEGRAQVSTSTGTEPRWGPGGREAFYWSGDTLFAAPITSGATLSVGARRQVLEGQYMHDPFHSNYDVGPDGKTFVMLRTDVSHSSGSLSVLVNWFAAPR